MRSEKNKHITISNFAASYLAIREGEFVLLFHAGTLCQQFVIDLCHMIEMNDLNYARYNQQKIYAIPKERVGGKDKEKMKDEGDQIILPPSYYRSPRFYHQLYLNAMSLVLKFGKPDLFITFTCNPMWKDIKNLLLPHQTPMDRPDIVSRIYYIKFQ